MSNLNNHTKKLFKNFCIEFEGVNPQKLDFFTYATILSWFINCNNLKQLNNELKTILKELYLLEIKDPVKYLDY